MPAPTVGTMTETDKLTTLLTQDVIAGKIPPKIFLPDLVLRDNTGMFRRAEDRVIARQLYPPIVLRGNTGMETHALRRAAAVLVQALRMRWEDTVC